MANTEAARFWSELAPTWVELDERLDEVAGEPGRLAQDRLEARPGDHVVDLGCGTGGTTLDLAARVAPDGDVLGVDIAPEMLVRARERAVEGNVGNVSFLHADAQVHDFGAGQFDRAYSRFGVMFFVDPVAAFANVRRALRPGGRLSFAAWQNVFANEWMLIPATAALSTLKVPLPEVAPDEPGPFALADPDRVRSLLGAAGFHGIDLVAHDDWVTTPEGRLADVAAVSSRVGLVNELLRDAGEDKRQRVVAAIEEALRTRLVDGEVRVTRAAWLVVADA